MTVDLTAVRAAFDPDAFGRTGQTLLHTLTTHLRRALSGDPTLAVLPARSPAQNVHDWQLPTHPAGTVDQFLAKVIEQSNHLHHPHYVGHQVTSPLPAAALCDLVGTLLNNGTAVFEMGPVTTAMERILVRFLGAALGMPEADGVFTSGGSAGNLTALLAARQAKAGFDVWKDGAHAGPPLAVLVGEQTHYSVARALQIMGLGEGGAWPVPVDGAFKLNPAALEDARRAAEAAGRRVFAVVASAGSTATGAHDPLEATADFCARHNLWLHVDGAHGASAALSSRLRPLLAGIERADSVVWDAHKMLLMPALTTAVIYRNPRRSYEAFAQEASYLFAGVEPEAQWFNLGQRTLECTKSMMVMKLWIALAVYGPQFFSTYVEGMYALARRFAEQIAAASDFQLAVVPESNIVCFRHCPPGADPTALDAIQERARASLLASGSYYLVQTKLRGAIYLRTTIINPFTSDRDLLFLLQAIRDVTAAPPPT